MLRWVWAAPKQVERADGMIRFGGWRNYRPTRVPAMWLRLADLDTAVQGWLAALEQFGPLYDSFDEQPRDEETLRIPWQQTIEGLAAASFLWRKEEHGIWMLPVAPIELAKGYRRLRAELARVAHDGVRLAAHDLDLVPEPQTLDAYLWLSAAESVRERHRFKRCARCGGWFSIQRTDALFCSAVCRNAREAA
jgi:hypothetical protein